MDKKIAVFRRNDFNCCNSAALVRIANLPGKGNEPVKLKQQEDDKEGLDNQDQPLNGQTQYGFVHCHDYDIQEQSEDCPHHKEKPGEFDILPEGVRSFRLFVNLLHESLLKIGEGHFHPRFPHQLPYKLLFSL